MIKLQKTKIRPLDALVTLLILLCATLLCLVLRQVGDGYAATLFMLSVMLVSRFTSGYLWGVVASVAGVFLVNYVFTYPYMAFNFTLAGYPVTFVSMLLACVVISTLTTQIKAQERVRAEVEKERIRANLLRAISHDLRTPLTSILGASSAILENNEQLDDTRRLALVGEINEDAQWLIRMVENLLSITRVDGGAARIRKTSEAAEEVVAESVRKFQKRFPDREVRVRAPDTLLMAPMDALLIEQVLINLLENAALHGVTTTEIELTLRAEGDFVIFEVRDDGMGIPKNVFEHLFEPYAHSDRGDSARGMGIGLSVCLSIIKAHGGQMDARNVEPHGALFRFTLPLSENALDKRG